MRDITLNKEELKIKNLTKYIELYIKTNVIEVGVITLCFNNKIYFDIELSQDETGKEFMSIKRWTFYKGRKYIEKIQFVSNGEIKNFGS